MRKIYLCSLLDKKSLESRNELSLDLLYYSVRNNNLFYIHYNDLLKKKFKKEDSYLFCFSLMFYNQLKEIEKIYIYLCEQEIDITVLIGGQFATIYCNEILNNYSFIDFIAIGDGEFFFDKIVENFLTDNELKKIDNVAYRNFQNEINFSLKTYNNMFKKYPTYQNNYKKINIVTSRGCPYSCTYCTSSIYRKYNTLREREPEDVVGEIEKWKSKSILPEEISFNIVADDIFFSKSKFKKFINLLVKKNIKNNFFFDIRANFLDEKDIEIFKEINTFSIFIGCEFWNQEELDIYNKEVKLYQNKAIIKNLKKYGIWFSLGLMYLHPYSTVDLFLKNLEVSQKIGWEHFKKMFMFGKLIAFSRTQLIGKLKKDNLLKKNNIFYYDYKYIDEKLEIIDYLTNYYQSKLNSFIANYQDYPQIGYLTNLIFRPHPIYINLIKELNHVNKSLYKSFLIDAKKSLDVLIDKRKTDIRRIVDVTSTY